MKIKFLKKHPELKQEAGDVAEFDEYRGVVLVAAGFAEEVKDQPKPAKSATNDQDKA